MSVERDTVTCLLVDDREENLVALEAVLAQDDLRILRARSGEEALELLLDEDVGLAIVDVKMPGMDGFELAELMRGTERSRHVPIIFVTAGTHDPRRVFEGYDSGAVDFLHKPIDPRILRNKANVFFELARQRVRLAQALRVQEMFVAALGHDLRNPLNSISMVAQLLARADGLDPKQRELVGLLSSSSTRMSHMISQLFDVARVRLGDGLSLDVVSCDLASLTRGVVEEERVAAGCEIVLDAPDALPLEADPARVSRVVSNLVGNAAAHRSGGIVSVRVLREDGRAVLEVHNEGAIDPRSLPSLFDPFVRHARSRQRRDGLGLGLYIVRQIMLAHGGEVAVASTAKGGTTFRAWLPAG